MGTLKKFVEAAGEKLCPKCQCCTMFWEQCEVCGGEGYNGHDCGEDCCVCGDPEDQNLICDYCRGERGHWACSCDEKGEHNHPYPEHDNYPPANRAKADRGM